MKDLIIDTPSMQSLWQRFSSVIFTFVFWVLWFFIWIPLVTVFAWYLGIDLIYFEMFEMDGYKALMDDVFEFIRVVSLLGGALAIWAAYNYFRFRGKKRRVAPAQVSSKEMAEYFEVKEAELHENQQAKLISVSFDDTGKIIRMTRQDFSG
jgi:biofilm PGA synthesis protein PgaD